MRADALPFEDVYAGLEARSASHVKGGVQRLLTVVQRNAKDRNRSRVGRFRRCERISGLLASAVFATPATTQQWRQTARVMADVDGGRPPSAFLDALTHHLRHRDTMAVRRSPTDPLPMTKEALVDSLLDDGLGLQSANRLRIGVRVRGQRARRADPEPLLFLSACRVHRDRRTHSVPRR